MEPPDSQAGKAAWRRWARGLLPPSPVVAQEIAAALVPFLREVDGLVLGYVALPDEVDVAAVLATLDPDRLALPRLGDDGSMSIHLDGDDREDHALGFAQPPGHAPVIRPDELGAVVVPGRVFDRRGFRLGRGGGHYDRLVPQLPSTTAVVGVVPADRVVDRLPVEAHDRPMTHLATEHGVVTVRA